MSGSIYIILNTLNGDYYIGKTRKRVETRLKEHFKAARYGSETHLHRAIRKYGEQSFSIKSLVDGVLDELDELEKKYIAEMNPLYNMTPGGEGGSSFKGQMTIITNGAKHKFHPVNEPIPEGFIKGLSDTTREKLRERGTGRKHTEESKAKMSQSRTGNNLACGCVSQESRDKLSASLTGRKLSDETKEKMSAAKKGKKRAPFSEETKAKMQAAQQKRHRK